MIITQDGEQTVIDGEGNKTFVKQHTPVGFTFGGMLSIGDQVPPLSIRNFNMERLTGNPFKDCWTLLRLYFSRRTV